MTPTALEDYARRFAQLRVDREANRPRPHKAVMLLSIRAVASVGSSHTKQSTGVIEADAFSLAFF